ncbi:MAG: hypothetical protein A2W19_06540 [Spirochaetes bacterium RBG_16_49_21]|nr:MAG: hypothetical protein A2W19_06540 [Spirochaetes bacterium RBG_16_49_21]
MTGKPDYLIALFNSVSHVIRAERILNGQGIPHKIVPVPKHISSDCGVCIRFLPEYRDQIIQKLEGKTEIIEIREL